MVFRCDGGPHLGAGHVMRCHAMAERLKSLGWNYRFAVGAGSQLDFLDTSQYDRIILNQHDEPDELGQKLGEDCALLVVDHYGLDAKYESGCRKWAQKICVFDDLANRTHDCDMLVDFTPHRPPSHYYNRVPRGCQVLTGPDYAPLRQEFFFTRIDQNNSKIKNLVPHLLIAPGSTDPSDITSHVLEAIRYTKLDIEVTVLLGADAPHKDQVAALLKMVDGSLLINCDEIAPTMAKADLILGAGGMGSWERCCLSKPSIMVVNADNQKANAQALASVGAAQIIEASNDINKIGSAISSLLNNKKTLMKMAVNAGRLCDGLGSSRLALAIEKTARKKSAKPVCLRPALESDAAMMLDWQRHPITRKFARNATRPTFQKHLAWLTDKLADPWCIINIITYGNKPVGVLRFDYLVEKGGFEVSILVASAFQNLGIASHALAQAPILFSDWDLYAYINSANETSIKLFRRAGYLHTSDPGWHRLPKMACSY